MVYQSHHDHPNSVANYFKHWDDYMKVQGAKKDDKKTPKNYFTLLTPLEKAATANEEHPLIKLYEE